MPMLKAVSLLLVAGACAVACGRPQADEVVLTISASAVGAEARALERQLRRFVRRHPGVRVVPRRTPDAADQRHQLYVQWLNARARDPDILQLDVIWTAEFAAAGWILPLDRFRPDTAAFLPRTIEADRWEGRLFALPWFVDVGMLYYRTDLVSEPPATFDELTRVAEAVRRRHGLDYGFVWQGARYEGLVTVFLEHVRGFGGRILGPDQRVDVDGDEAVRALTYMTDSIRRTRVVPESVLTWQEEQARFAFQNGRAVFMRNWPYAYPLLEDPAKSRVAGRVGVAPMPAAPGGISTAALGGSQLAINAHTEHPRVAFELVDFLTRPRQMAERARLVGQYPTRPALYDDAELRDALAIDPRTARRIVEKAEPRPVSPVYTELSELLQVRLHRALTGQEEPRPALEAAAREMRRVLASARLGPGRPRAAVRTGAGRVAATVLLLLCGALILVWLARRGRAPGERAAVVATGAEAREARLAWAFLLPALLAIALVAIFPLVWTVWESLHGADLRMPWLGRPFVGLDNYLAALTEPRFLAAMGHTLFFTVSSVTLELVLGLVLALALNLGYRGRGLVRAAVLVPWAIPTVVAALVWRFMFDGQSGIANAVLTSAGAIDRPIAWFVHSTSAWVPVILADVWKTTPFVALLLLAGLQNIDESLYEAASIDGARAWQRFVHVTLPLLKPAILVALLFRTLDAFRVFDLVYVLTGGGPGTATEPIALYTFTSLLQNLRFGYGSALSVIVFLATLVLAVVYIRVLGTDLTRTRE
ncbi:MAG: extracellular solute-binding protein [Deltaproteobacteria bacterium]|nr:extracellular solute-binding protein [Deltaproteobacteria bacterium]